MLPKNTKLLLLFPLLLTVVLSCAGISPVTQMREHPAIFPVIEHISPRWQLYYDGVDYFHGKVSKPKIEFWALRIELASAAIQVYVDGGAVTDDQTFSRNVSSFVRDNNLIAGINALPFDVVSAKEGEPIKNMGLVISGGNLISPAHPGYDALIFYKDGTVSIIKQAEAIGLSEIENAAGGFHMILSSGEPVERVYPESRHPRSAAGISPNGEYLYLLVIDGRRAGSIGATELETALLLRSLGAKEGLNFDGGGSSALVLRYPDGKIRAVNTPIHRQIYGLERAVAGCLGIIYHSSNPPLQ